MITQYFYENFKVNLLQRKALYYYKIDFSVLAHYFFFKYDSL